MSTIDDRLDVIKDSLQTLSANIKMEVMSSFLARRQSRENMSKYRDMMRSNDYFNAVEFGHAQDLPKDVVGLARRKYMQEEIAGGYARPVESMAD
tara:strand:- start:2221 stop:2505 length:285 start_codon:yes stop_codon:yes gene_type:complete